VSRKIVAQTALACILGLALISIVGCSRTSSMQEIADTSGWFHVRVPAKWQATTNADSILIVADKDLPTSEDDAFDSLSMQIFVSDTAGPAPVAKSLTALVNARATSREWSKVKLSAPAKVEIGKRAAWAVDIKATDSKDREFAGRIALVRTNDRDALIVALAPLDVWEKTGADATEDLYREWYWHEPASGQSTSTPAPKP